MSYAIGTVAKNGGDDCHYQLLGIIKTLAESNGWVTQRYDTSNADKEWIGKSTGFSGTEEIYIGLKTYQSATGDYYNYNAGTFTGYLSANSFEAQPGSKYCGVPAHNNAITYYATINKQRLVFMLKVGTPVYTHGYIGKFIPYARPSEFPAPLICAGSFNGPEQKRFSEPNQAFPYHGLAYNYNNAYLRRPDGVWDQFSMWPFSQKNTATQYNVFAATPSANTYCQVPIDGIYQTESIIFTEIDKGSFSNVFGEFDGVQFISGFNNTAENIVQLGGSSVVDQTSLSQLAAVDAILAVGGRAFVMGQNINKTSWNDYVGIEMS